jgi:AcrR family transcriptional regulator
VSSVRATAPEQELVTIDEPAGADTSDERARPQRADARRNRDKLMVAASEAFAEHGIDTSLEDIARKAGVGIGTLYRHFPSRDALMEAVYRHQVEALCRQADELLATSTPVDALAVWMQQFVGYVATKRGMATALKAVVGKDSELFAYTHGLIHVCIDNLLARAAESGAIRSDVEGGDLMRALSGICLVSDQEGWQEQARRLVALLLDGLRYQPAATS